MGRSKSVWARIAGVGEAEERELGLGRALNAEVPKPTGEYRRRAWLAFQQALDRSLVTKRQRPPRSSA